MCYSLLATILSKMVQLSVMNGEKLLYYYCNLISSCVNVFLLFSHHVSLCWIKMLTQDQMSFIIIIIITTLFWKSAVCTCKNDLYELKNKMPKVFMSFFIKLKKFYELSLVDHVCKMPYLCVTHARRYDCSLFDLPILWSTKQNNWWFYCIRILTLISRINNMDQCITK